MKEHPCVHWAEGRCRHTGLPYGERPSGGVCLKVCMAYEGPDRGLGDTVARFTRVTGIAGVVNLVAKATGKDCGCSKRRAKLNGAVSFAAVAGDEGVKGLEKKEEKDESINQE